MQNDRTPNLNLPLPSAQNYLEQDLPRLREALTGLDTAAGFASAGLEALDTVLSQESDARAQGDQALALALGHEQAARETLEGKLSVAPVSATIAVRDAAGRLQSAAPATAADVATREYVDTAAPAASPADAGKVLTAGEDGSAQWLESSGDDGVPLLFVNWSTTGIPEPGYLDISQDNGLLARAAFPEAWEKLEAAIAAGQTSVISESAWQNEKTTNGGVCGKFSTGDGSTTFRAPLVGKRFVRATGPGLDVGTAQGDAIRNIKGQMYLGSSVAPDATAPQEPPFANGTTSRTNHVSGSPATTRDILFNASLSVPTAEENRPVSVAYTPMLKMYGAPVDAGQLDLAALVQSLALKLDAVVFEQWQDDTDDLRAFAWVTFNGTGAIVASKNIASVVRAATGYFRITFLVAASNANYGVLAMESAYGRTGAGGGTANTMTTRIEDSSTYPKSAASCVLKCIDSAQTLLNPSNMHVRFYGE